MLSAIFSAIGGPLVSAIIDPFVKLAGQYLGGQITKAELEAKTQGLLIENAAKVEVAHADALTKTYASFMTAAVQSRMLKFGWAAVLFSQLFVLVWHQFGIPFVIAIGWATAWPPSGSTVTWAYALVGGCVGLGPLVLRTGPGAPQVKAKS